MLKDSHIGRPQCKSCGSPCMRNSTKKNKVYYSSICSKCHYDKIKHKRNKFVGKYKYRAFKKDKCKLCGFVPINPCQLDVDHIDGNKKNTKETNLQTLCANCHRLKTFLNKDGCYKNT